MLRWFTRRLRDAQTEQKGFTLIELLVVIIIIGILAAIALPTFLAQRERSWEAAAQSDLRNAASAATSCSTAFGGSYASCDLAALPTYGFNQTEGVTLTPGAIDANTWTMQSQHDLDVANPTLYEFGTASTPPSQVFCVSGCPDGAT